MPLISSILYMSIQKCQSKFSVLRTASGEFFIQNAHSLTVSMYISHFQMICPSYLPS